MSRICDISGKRANNANRVSFSNKHWARWQYPNLQSKKLYSKELDRYVRVKVATSTLRTIRKLGLDETAKKVRDRAAFFLLAGTGEQTAFCPSFRLLTMRPLSLSLDCSTMLTSPSSRLACVLYARGGRGVGYRCGGGGSSLSRGVTLVGQR